MSVKGFPSNQKNIHATSGITHNYATVVPTDPYRHGLDVNRFAFRVDSDTVPRTCGASTGNADSGPTVVVDTATPARVGDIFRAETGNAAFLEVPIVSVSVNGFILASRLSSPPAAGDTFYILRSVTQRTSETGSQLVTLTPSPVAFVLNGVDTEVEQDTGTPANSIPLPVILLNPNGTEVTPGTEATLQSIDAELQALNLTDFASETTLAAAAADLALIKAKDFATETTLASIAADIALVEAKTPAFGQGTMSASVPVVIASDQSPIPVSGPLTDAELRASAVPVSGPLTDTELRATAVPVSASALPLPTGAATEATLAAASAKLPATLGQKAMAASMSVVLSSDQSSIPVAATLAAETTKVIGTVNTKSPVNANGSNTDSTVSTVATLTAPANAVGFILMNLDTSSGNIRWRIGAVATSSAGQQLQAGRDTGFIPCAADISICAESGTQNYNVQWILSA